MRHFNFSNILSAVLLIVGLFVTTSAFAQQKQYTNGVFMLNEGNFGKQRATINFLDQNGKWEYRLPITMDNRPIELGTTGCYATICGENMYIVNKKQKVNDLDTFDPTLVVCNAKTLEAYATINSIKTEYGAADGRAFLPVADLEKGYLSTTNGIYVISLQSYSTLSHIKGTDGIANNQTGNMIYRNGKVYAVDLKRGLLVIDAEKDELLKAINNEKELSLMCVYIKLVDVLSVGPRSCCTIPEESVLCSRSRKTVGIPSAPVVGRLFYVFGQSDILSCFSLGVELYEVVGSFAACTFSGCQPYRAVFSLDDRAVGVTLFLVVNGF